MSDAPAKSFVIRAHWDQDASVWVAESDEVPGLVAEAESPNALAEKLRVLIPELLELNGVRATGGARFEVHEEIQRAEEPSTPRKSLYDLLTQPPFAGSELDVERRKE